MSGLLRKKFKPRRVHVIGGGMAGLACAIKLQDAGVPVTLYEATTQAGGRCRSYHDNQLGRLLDNGNHLILRGNKATWRMIGRLKSFTEFYGSTPDYVFHDAARKRQWQLSPPAIPKMWQAWKLLLANKDRTVAQCFNTSSAFYREFVTPLCLAALNTKPEEASAACLRQVWLRLLLPGNADYLQIRTDFNRALIAPALDIINKVELAQRLRQIETQSGHATALQFTEFRLPLKDDERVVLAVPPDVATTLLPSLKLPELEHHAIINGHFLFDSDALVPRLLGVVNSPLHWVFLKDGLISTTTSHAESSSLWGRTNVAELLWEELGKCYTALAGKPMPPHRIVTEKRATIAASPANLAKRPDAKTPLQNVTLAGDWLDSPLPACIEAAIRSGEKAADWCLARPSQ